MAYTITKAIKKELADIASKLPVVPVGVKESVSGHKIKTDKRYLKYRRDEIKSNLQYDVVIKEGSPQAINHRRRLEKEFEQGGEKAVAQYIRRYADIDKVPDINEVKSES